VVKILSPATARGTATLELLDVGGRTSLVMLPSYPYRALYPTDPNLPSNPIRPLVLGPVALDNLRTARLNAANVGSVSYPIDPTRVRLAFYSDSGALIIQQTSPCPGQGGEPGPERVT
jgi:hypothetical protein